jgi:DNA polymerase-4
MTTKAEDLMALLLQVTTQIKSLSCDESFVRIRDDPAGVWDPDDLATLIRDAITRVTGGLTVSVGIGHSTIAARFATTKAKPPGVGVFRLTQDEVTHALRDASPSVVSGIGKSTVEKLSVLGVKTCADLLAVPIAVLQARFGASQGMNFHTMAKGNDFITTDEKSFDVWADVDQVSLDPILRYMNLELLAFASHRVTDGYGGGVVLLRSQQRCRTK